MKSKTKSTANLTARGELAKQKIKQAALAILEVKAYHKMKITDVTTAAGVATGLFYHYFPNLKALMLEILTEFVHRSEAFTEVEKGIGKGDWYRRIYTNLEIHVSNHAEHPGLMRCLLQLSDDEPMFEKLYQESSLRQLNLLANLIPKLFPETQLSHGEALLVVTALGNTASGLLRDYYISRTPDLVANQLTQAEITELLAVMFYRGLFLQNPPQGQLNIGRKLESLVKLM